MLKRLVASAVLLVGLAHPAYSMSWELDREVDAFTDSQVVRAIVRGNDLFMPKSIVVRCENRNLEAFVSVGDFLGSGDSIKIRYRIDEGRVVSEHWSPSTKGTAAFAHNPQRFAKNLIHGNYIVVEAEDFQGTPHRAKFSLSGSARTVSAVLEACDIV